MHAFAGCTSLEELIIADSKNDITIYENSFENSHLTNIYIGRNIKANSLKFGNFLKNLIIGKEVSSLENIIFDSDSNIEHITSMCDTPPSISENTFNETTYSNATLHVPNGRILIYTLDTYWKKFFKFKDDAAVGINIIKLNGEEKAMIKKIYTIGGMLYKSKSVSDMKPGIYVISGKKILVK